MPKSNLSQKELKESLRRLALMRETHKKQEANWLAAVNNTMGRSFTVAMYAEATLRNELKHMEEATDPYESARDTIDRIVEDVEQAYVNRLVQ
jgi:hypothetical protein